MSATYLLQAYNLYHSIAIKSVRAVLNGRIIDSSPSELQVQYGDDSYLFVYRFGALVFFNMSQEQIDEEMGKIKSVLGPTVVNTTTETFQIQIGTQDRFDFDFVELREVTPQSLSMVALTVGQSAALETYEINSDSMLRDSADFMQRLEKIGSVPLRAKVLLKFIGSAASTRQSIVSNLAILDPPEETWRSHDMQKLFKEAQQCFDIDVRFRALDRKLTLVQDNIEILANLVSSRRANILEVLIIALIALELILALIKKS
ncbi:MAG: RMD1 family protein [Proteobacteria bacterium]|nr:RMD1 family protein [Pseudomonadota bacterium]